VNWVALRQGTLHTAPYNAAVNRPAQTGSEKYLFISGSVPSSFHPGSKANELENHAPSGLKTATK